MSYNDELFLWIHFNCNVSIFLDFYTIRANFLKLFSNTCVSTFLDSTYISISFPLGILHCASSIMASISYSWLWIRSLIWKEIRIKWKTIFLKLKTEKWCLSFVYIITIVCIHIYVLFQQVQSWNIIFFHIHYFICNSLLEVLQKTIIQHSFSQFTASWDPHQIMVV